MSNHLFSHLSIRGPVGTVISPEFAHSLGCSFAIFLKERLHSRPIKIVIGRDNRNTSSDLSDSFSKGLMRMGIEVHDCGVITTPVLNFSIKGFQYSGGTMVTGSHNPANINGFKLYLNDSPLSSAELKQVLDFSSVNHITTSSPKGTTRELNTISVYIDHITRLGIPNKRPFKVSLDAGNGTVSLVGPETFRRLGVKTVPLFCTLDSRFPNHHPNPAEDSNLVQLQKLVIENKSDFGAAFDTDGDRLRILDNNGRILSTEQTAFIFASEILKENPSSSIAFDSKISPFLEDTISDLGGHVVLSPTGGNNIRPILKSKKIPFAVEQSGHYYFSDTYMGFDDAVYAAVRLYNILQKSNRKLSELADEYKGQYPYFEVRTEMAPNISDDLVKDLRPIFEEKFLVQNFDGIRFRIGSETAGFLRASKTEPVLVLKIESVDEATLVKAKQEVLGIINEKLCERGCPILTE